VAHGGGQLDVASAHAEIVFVLLPNEEQVVPERRDEGCWQWSDPIFSAFAIAYAQLAAIEVEVLDAKACAFEEPQARTVEQAGHQPERAAEARKKRRYFLRRQDEGQTFGAASTDVGVSVTRVRGGGGVWSREGWAGGAQIEMDAPCYEVAPPISHQPSAISRAPYG
jgi:hypothetical protein